MEVIDTKQVDLHIPVPQKANLEACGLSESKWRDRISQRLAYIPKAYQGVWMRALHGRAKAAAIKAKCQDCVGWEDVAKNVGMCAAVTCPLWPHRPYQKRDKANHA
jgi:hypothetical protein